MAIVRQRKEIEIMDIKYNRGVEPCKECGCTTSVETNKDDEVLMRTGSRCGAKYGPGAKLFNALVDVCQKPVIVKPLVDYDVD